MTSLHYAVTLTIPRTKLPTVVTIHDVQPHARPEAYSRALKLYRRYAYDGAARKATRVIAVSEYIAGDR